MSDTAETQTESSQVEDDSKCGKLTPQFTLNIGVHRLRVVAGSFVTAGVLIGAMLPFARDGMHVATFQSNEMDDAGQKRLLDKYNSISGSLAVLLMKPLDVFLSMMVAVVFLCVATKYSVYHENQRRYLATGVIGLMGYLMNTGFSALNMQVISGKTRPRILPADLAVENTDVGDNTQALDDNGLLTTTWNPKFREDTPGNSVYNTIMRNLFTATEEVPNWCNHSDAYRYPYKNLIPSYGFPSRSWQHLALSKAVEPTASLRMSMKAKSSDLPSDEDLPMDISIATNLVVYSSLVSNSFLGWWSVYDEAWSPWSPNYRALNGSGSYDMAEYLNLTRRSSENATFVSDVHQLIVDYYNKAENASTDDELAKMEFSHFDLSGTVVFDALTVEIPTQKFHDDSTNISDSDPYFTTLDEYECNRDACLVKGAKEFNADGTETTIYPRVQALAICLNDAGGENLVVNFDYYQPNQVLQACDHRSNSSMIIVSIGKHVQGDSFEDHFLTRPNTRLLNARMVYSLTVGRLSCASDNLAETYNATCDAAGTGCRGIEFPLEKANHSPTSDRLLVSDDSIPLNLLSPINMNVNWFSVGATKWKILASVLEETRGGALETETTIEPIALPRNFKTVNSTLPTYMQNLYCELIVNNRINHIEKNHLYIEHSLQPAYTAGLYFIFQNAVVLKRLPLNATDYPDKPSLEFSGNIKEMHVQASIPTISMLLAIYGCTIMILGGIVIALLGKQGETSLLEHGTADTAAEAIANRDKFPPCMLRLQLRDCSTGELVDVPVDSLCVENVILVDMGDKSKQFVVVGSRFSSPGLDQVKPYATKDAVEGESDDDAQIHISRL